MPLPEVRLVIEAKLGLLLAVVADGRGASDLRV